MPLEPSKDTTLSIEDKARAIIDGARIQGTLPEMLATMEEIYSVMKVMPIDKTITSYTIFDDNISTHFETILEQAGKYYYCEISPTQYAVAFINNFHLIEVTQGRQFEINAIWAEIS